MKAPHLCISCKGGKFLCGQRPCPLLARIKIQPQIKDKVSDEFYGPATSVFVGHHGYPTVNIGPMAALVSDESMDVSGTRHKDSVPEHAQESRKFGLKILDNPSTWYGKSYSELIEMRSLMMRTKVRQAIKGKTKFILENQELALAKKPTEVEMLFRKKPIYKMSFSEVHQPSGPIASIQKMYVTENVKVPKKTEYIISDELSAANQIQKLFVNENDVYKIMNILSSGAMGFDKNKRLVPTRWSIVAVQDTLAKMLIKEVKQFKIIDKVYVAESKFLDNHFIVLMLPGSWEFENFETWSPGSMWSQSLTELQTVEEYEPYQGRKRYADKQGGGYYSSRMGCTEGLYKMRRQAKIIVFREIYDGYTVPVGSWQILENVRAAFRRPVKQFDTRYEAFEYIRPKLRYPLEEYMKRSEILRQQRLTDFFPY